MHDRGSAAPSLSASATAHALPWQPLVDELRVVVLELDHARVTCPERLVVPMADGGLMLSMPAVAADIAVHKLITVTPKNAALGLPTIQGQVSVLDAGTGRALLMLDGPTVTGRRTAAMSMLGIGVCIGSMWATAPRHVLIIGTGAQAAHHVEAIAALYPQTRVSVRGSSASSAERFCQRHRQVHSSMVADDGHGDFDVVITCTSSRSPVYTEAARAGRLVIAVGAFRPDSAEIGAATVLGSSVVVDDPAGARHEAGDLLLAGVDWERVWPLARVLRHGAPPEAPVLFKTVGCAAWDLAAARVALTRSSEKDQTRSF